MKIPPKRESVAAWARLFRVYKILLEQSEQELLEVHDAPGQRIRQFELGQKVLLPKYNLSRLLDRLQNEALLNRETCPEDRRGAVITLTPGGRRLLKRMWAVYGGTIRERFEARLTERDVALLERTLAKLLD
jgi:DNA-binding MarR family transcriptional regulator